jgi:hypothetical protein
MMQDRLSNDVDVLQSMSSPGLLEVAAAGAGLAHRLFSSQRSAEPDTTVAPILEEASMAESKSISTAAAPGTELLESNESLPAAEPAERPYFRNLKAGSKDELLGVEVYLILHKAHTFIVYLDTEKRLRWSDIFENDPPFFATVLNRVGYLEARSEFLHYVGTDRRPLISAKTLIGEGVIQLFSTRDEARANAALDTAEKFIEQRAAEASRVWYFLPFSMLFAICLVVLAGCFWLDPSFAKTLPLVCCAGGGLGAFISSAIGNTRIPCAAGAGKSLHYLEAAIRWCVGLAAGGLLYLLSRGDIAVGLLDSTKNSYGLLAVAILAGASERLLPSLIKRFDDSGSQPSTKDQPNAASRK